MGEQDRISNRQNRQRPLFLYFGVIFGFVTRDCCAMILLECISLKF
jgi:hypothetical protein